MIIEWWWVIIPLLIFWLWMARVEPVHELKPTQRLSVLQIKLSEDEATRKEYEDKKL